MLAPDVWLLFCFWLSRILSLAVSSDLLTGLNDFCLMLWLAWRILILWRVVPDGEPGAEAVLSDKLADCYCDLSPPTFVALFPMRVCMLFLDVKNFFGPGLWNLRLPLNLVKVEFSYWLACWGKWRGLLSFSKKSATSPFFTTFLGDLGISKMVFKSIF